MSAQPRKLEGGCHCRAVRYTLTIPDGSERLVAGYCHCDDCRLTTGFYCALFADIEPGWLSFSEQSKASITSYKSSDRVVRTFCSKCSTTLTYTSTVFGHELSVPTLDVQDDWKHGVREVVRVKAHNFVSDTTAGGVSTIFDDGLPRYVHGSRGDKWSPPSVSAVPQTVEDETGDEIRGGCHCSGVTFKIQRPPLDYTKDPDLVNWVATGRKFTALHCVCNDCRLAPGTPFFTWSYVPHKLIHFTRDDTLRIRVSNPTKNVLRRFCGTCGCHLFTNIDDGRAYWDVSAAVLEQPKAERWITLTSRFPTSEDRTSLAEGGKNAQCWFASERLWHESSGAKFDPELVEELKRGLERAPIYT
ncbi:hypothetical protein EXIGLDRAFT_828138 [Exidia glandulosa HHB12029]|uniref:CENP-V/GFA domain-containing protein n=1 Tax=Exidia glandulosa HHB12029 TaxID=1314781 RepID=A0A165QY07_EXIGL|nr:hypothetical protein EXIGLDRAFT_828138 [Exidia glandulosa HHB12029]